jgi:hypothetical protein
MTRQRDEGDMTSTLREAVRKLPDLEKLALVDEILIELDRPDPEIDAAWAAVARERREAYKVGKTDSVAYDGVMKRYRKS